MRYLTPRARFWLSSLLAFSWFASLAAMRPTPAFAPEMSTSQPQLTAEVWTITTPAETAEGEKRRRLNFYREYSGELSPEQLKELLSLVGFEGEGLRDAWAVAMKESRGYTDAHNLNYDTKDNSYGLFQINMIGDLGGARRSEYGLSSNEELLNPVKNAEIAFILSKQGTDFGHWGIGPNAYKGGKPRDFPYWLTQYPEDSNGRS